MQSISRFLFSLSLLLILITTCAPKADPERQVNQAVAATIAAIPTSTPYPTQAPYPSPTAILLKGLFCEYQFCIGHPAGTAFFDVSAQRDPGNPSSYTQGLLAAYNTNLFIELLWQHSPDTADPKFMLDLILEDEIDRPVGSLDVMLIRDMNIIYTSITTSASDVLPFGGAAAWTCGDRVFAWKAYTPQEDQAAGFFEEALQRFRCQD